MTELNLTGKVALVTGAGRGIGKGIALRLASHGADIVVNDINTESAEQTAKEVKKLGRRALAIPADISATVEIDRIFDLTQKVNDIIQPMR